MKEDLKNIIKQTADNHLDDINPDIIWSGIESKLSSKEEKAFCWLLDIWRIKPCCGYADLCFCGVF